MSYILFSEKFSFISMSVWLYERNEILYIMFDKAQHGSLPNYYKSKPPPTSSPVLSLWRTLIPKPNIFYVSVSDQLINQTYTQYD